MSTHARRVARTRTDQWRNRVEIKSASSSRVYVVAQRISTGLWECSCPGWKSRRRCKHLTAMALATQDPITPARAGRGTGDDVTFTDAAYKHYDIRGGFGSTAEWHRLAEDLIRGRGRYRRPAHPVHALTDDMALLELTEMPAEAKGLLVAMRKMAMKLHPDHGGDAEEFKTMFAAYERLTRMY